MKWIEIIELRSSGENHGLLEKQLHKLVQKTKKEGRKHHIVAYKRVLIDSDYSIHIFHDSNRVPKHGSRLGTILAEELRVFGLVNHRLWTEM